MDKATTPKRVLVTGSTGAIGQPVCRHLLARGHTVRGFARRPTPHVEDYVVGDLNDKDKVYEAVEGMDTVIHLGAYPDVADFIDVLLQPNVVGLHYVCEAAREHKVDRLVLSSSTQTIAGHGFPDRIIRIEDGPTPTNHYALTKVWAEVMGDMLARCHDISVISVRIGWLPRNRTEAKSLISNPGGPNLFFSHDDAQRFYERCVESETPNLGESAILFAASKPLTATRLDLEPAKRVIGYVPQDAWPEGLPYSVEGLGED